MDETIECLKNRAANSPLIDCYKGCAGACMSEPYFKTIYEPSILPNESGTYLVCTALITNGKIENYLWSAVDYVNKKWVVDEGELVVAWTDLPPIPTVSLVFNHKDLTPKAEIHN